MTTSEDPASRLDHVIDSLIHDRPGSVSAAADDGLAETARLLRDALPRLHPSFSFEEHLAARLAAARRARPSWNGLTGTPAAASAGMAVVRPLRPTPPTTVGPAADGSAMAERRRRSLVAGGAIASGVSLALPIAGVAIVAWRRSRSSGGLL